MIKKKLFFFFKKSPIFFSSFFLKIGKEFSWKDTRKKNLNLRFRNKDFWMQKKFFEGPRSRFSKNYQGIIYLKFLDFLWQQYSHFQNLPVLKIHKLWKILLLHRIAFKSVSSSKSASLLPYVSFKNFKFSNSFCSSSEFFGIIKRKLFPRDCKKLTTSWNLEEMGYIILLYGFFQGKITFRLIPKLYINLLK